METLSNLISTLAGLPRLVAEVLSLFVQYLFAPYAAVLKACKFLRRRRISTDILLVIAFAFFVLSLGLQDTGQLILLTFEGGLATSLQRLSSIETKTREYFYLSAFVLAATIFSIAVGSVIRSVLRIKSSPARLFPDIFNVYASFTLGWFILLAIVSPKILSLSYLTSVRNSIGEGFQWLGLSNVSEVIISPAFAIIVVMSVYFASNFLKHWGIRRDFVDLLRKDKKGAFSQTQMIAFPIIVAVIMILGPAIFLAYLSDILYAKSESDAHFSYQASCAKNSQDLHANISIKNNLSKTALIGPLFLGLWQSNHQVSSKDRPPDQVVKIDPRDIMWASRKGLFLEPSEVKYLRLVNTHPTMVKDVAQCGLVNNIRGGPPCEKPGLCSDAYPHVIPIKLEYVIPTKVEGDAVSSSLAAVDTR